MAQPLPDLTFVRDLDQFDISGQVHARGAMNGSEVRVARGAYVPIAPWLDLKERDRYVVTIRAVAAKVHVSIGRVSGGRSRRGVVKHTLVVGDDEIVEVDGMLVTSIARTVLDLAAYADRLTAIVAVDRALLIDRFGPFPPLLG
ncbi:MAG TPA: hypothetical protein VHZ98_08860 [Galbitalea sp.]|nr:hypothetical protein [Galbitalea sp.]